MTLLFVALGLVVGGFIVGGIIAFLPSATLGQLERKIVPKGSDRPGDSSDPAPKKD
ncbi:MAG: hypothetical protein U0136_20695 [Bdellovibrionota bacterium]